MKYYIFTFLLTFLYINSTNANPNWRQVHVSDEITSYNIKKIICHDSLCIALNPFEAYTLELLKSNDAGNNWSKFISEKDTDFIYTWGYYTPVDMAFPDKRHVFVAFADTGIRIIDIESLEEDSIRLNQK